MGALPGEGAGLYYLRGVLMAAGFQCWNDGDMLQIDGNYSNAMLLKKQTKTTATSTFGYSYLQSGRNDYQEATFTFSAQDPVVAVSCAYPTILIGSTINRTSPYSCSMRFLVDTGRSDVSTSITIYVFGRQVASGAKYGMQVFNEDGALVFDALNKQMIVADFISPIGASSISDTTDYTYSLPAGRSYAAIVTKPMGVASWDGSPDPPQARLKMTWFASNTLHAKIASLSLAGGVGSWSIGSNSTVGSLSGGVAAVDVTGL